MAHGENNGTGIGLILKIIVVIILVILIFFSLVSPVKTNLFFSGINDSINSFFDSKVFVTAKLIAGITIVFLSGLVTWLFFRLLEMEKEHEGHVYHHAHADHKHDDVEHKDIKIEEKKGTKIVEKENTRNVEEKSLSDARLKTAPPPSRLPGESGVRGTQVGESNPGHFQWQSVLRLATSNNPSDWKLAIIEADVILDMMTYMHGFEGETLGERLKNADVGNFKNVKYAKYAHGMRNQIAHDPNISLTPRDINQIIRMYESVFNEFNYI
jgi:hypothetical protein